MNFAIPPIMGGVHGVATLEDILDAKVCQRIIDLQHISPRFKGAIQVKDKKRTEVIEDIRQVESYIIHQREEWVDQLLIEQAMKANQQIFEYNLSGLIERPQLLKYKAGSRGYDWHMDVGGGDSSNRKLSCSIILNDEYEGGELQFFMQGSQTQPTIKGNIIVFSSFLSHCVTPITRGERWALVAWFSGPQFR